jgi:uncharacterized protein involved in response to NO
MSTIPLQWTPRRSASGHFALFALGFRPFFLAATLYAVVAMVIWLLSYSGWATRLAPAGHSPFAWHGHELIYGYAMAVVAGFLLTAVRNWTSLPTINGWPLFLLLLCWLGGRLAPWLPLYSGVMLDLLFNLALTAAIAWPLWLKRQWLNLWTFVPKLLLIGVGNALYWLATLEWLELAPRVGLYLGLYLVLALIFVVGRRVIGFFIERGVAESVKLRNSPWVDRASLSIFLLFMLTDLALPNHGIVQLLALLLAALHTWRLWAWHTRGLWRVPLLWGLWLAYLAIVIGFVLKAATWIDVVAPLAWLHAFTLGGIATLSLSMMARVSLGHSGRSVANPPAMVAWVSAAILLAAVLRVIVPLLIPQWTLPLHQAAMGLWIVAFMLLFIRFAPIWWQPRIDGQPG